MSIFKYFYRHVVTSPNRNYIFHANRFISYIDAYRAVKKIANSIALLKPQADCAVLNFREPQKILLSFWACTLLDIDIILAPEIPKDQLNSQLSNTGLNVDIILSDFISGQNCYDPLINYDSDSNEMVDDFIDRKTINSSVYFFTSGTTNRSKFVETTFFQFENAIDCILQNNLMEYIYFQNVVITVPLFHSYGISAMIEYTSGGSCIFLPKNINPIEPLQTLLQKEVRFLATAIEGVPYFYKTLLRLSPRFHFPNLRHIGFGGDIVPKQLFQQISTTIPNTSISIRYGVTEIPSVIALLVLKCPKRLINHLGEVLPIYSTRLSHDSLDSPNEGELIVSCFKHRNIKEEIQTGDIMKYVDNSLTFVRRKISVKRRGYRINPVEIESLVNQNTNILDSRAYVLEERLILELVAQQTFDIKCIKALLSEKLPSSMVPDEITFVNHIRRTKTGKIIR